MNLRISKNKLKRNNVKLQEKKKLNLDSGIFRYINNKLYTLSSKDFLVELENNKKIEYSKCYHKNYQKQVASWPKHPVDEICAFLKTQSKPLTVFDLGCGTCDMYKNLKNIHKVISIDFGDFEDLLIDVPIHKSVEDVITEGGFIRRNITDLSEFEEESADVVIFSLSLMCKDWPDYISSAHRLLKKDGYLIIAEPVSRLEKKANFTKAITVNGYKLINETQQNAFFKVEILA
uniref:Ribosomal RNA-processing protein 8 n=1 Tax=Dermatophagoides pteronyssinus TaxID=6956 RepID=A0A6P6XKF8_DERPT|nr:ribosomal RNA-processing protein 8-like [Dermatophagoides pteronyssinus]